MYRFASTAILALVTALPAAAQQTSDVVVPEPETQVAQEWRGLSEAANAALDAKRVDCH